MPLKNGTGNKLLTTDKVAKDMLARWKNNLVLTKSVYRDLENEYGEIGDTVNVRMPNNVIVNDGRVATTTTPMNDTTVPLVVDTQKNVKFNWTMKDRKLSIVDFGERYLAPTSNRLANEVDRSIASEMRKAYFQFGTVGSALSYKEVELGSAYMADVGIPDDGLCRAILNTIDKANVSNEISDKYNDNLVKDAIQKGYAGELAGFNSYFSQNLYTHTVGTHTGNEQVASELAYGNQLQVSGGASGAFTVGDRFTIAGVYEINPITKQSTGRLQVFTVLAGTLSGATGTLTISPKLNAGTAAAVETDGNGTSITAAMDKNVSAVAASGAAITVLGVAGGVYRENFISHKHAIAAAIVLQDLPASGHGSRIRDKQTGLALNVAEYFDGDKYENALRVDVLYGVKMIRPDLIFRATCQKIG